MRKSKMQRMFEKKVEESVQLLSPLSNSEMDQAFNKLSPHTLKVDRYGNHFCCDCGHDWKGSKDAKTAICPHCGRKLTRDWSKKRLANPTCYFAKVTVCNGLQVMRMFYYSLFLGKGRKPIESCKEVYQQWFDPKNNLTAVYSLARLSLGYYIDSWNWSSNFAIRKIGPQHLLSPLFLVGKTKLLPIYKKYGLKGGFHGISPRYVLSELICNSELEKLWKMKQFDYISYCIINSNHCYFTKHWRSLMITHRHKYHIKDMSMWIDLLGFLAELKLDCYNPKFICPENLKKTHDHFMILAQKKMEKERIQREKREAEERMLRDLRDEKLFYATKTKFFNLIFEDKELVITPLKSLEEFREEGETQKICVFSSRYYARQDSLILHAKIEDKIIATIELNLNTMEVVQCRGKCNSEPEHKQRIENLIYKNIGKIAKCSKAAVVDAA